MYSLIAGTEMQRSAKSSSMLVWLFPFSFNFFSISMIILLLSCAKNIKFVEIIYRTQQQLVYNESLYNLFNEVPDLFLPVKDVSSSSWDDVAAYLGY